MRRFASRGFPSKPATMHLSAPAILCAVRPHGEHGAVVRGLTADHGLIAGYVQGARSRILRPVLIPGNEIRGSWRARVASQLASLSVEPLHSRSHLLTEPLASAGMEWATALTAATLPEEHPYPNLHAALGGLLSAIEHAPAARGWAGALARYEELLITELGYGDATLNSAEPAAAMNRNRERLVAQLLGDHHRDVMAARERLVERLKRAVA
jgi:DNA repair protein RecO (recombination protein O)